MDSIGGLSATIARSAANLAVLEVGAGCEVCVEWYGSHALSSQEFVSTRDWISFLAVRALLHTLFCTASNQGV